MPFNWFRKETSKSGENLPVYWQNYLATFQPIANPTPVEETLFIVLDIETTGLDHKNDQVLSIGAVKVKNWEMDLSKCLEIYLDKPLSHHPSAVEVHGILPVERSDAVTQQQALEQLLLFIGNGIIVGHHIAFDLAMLNRMIAKYTFGDRLRNQELDTAILARRVLQPAFHPGQGNGALGLDVLCKQFQIPTHDRHTAAGDAFITALLLLKLLARLEDRGVKTIGKLCRKWHW